MLESTLLSFKGSSTKNIFMQYRRLLCWLHLIVQGKAASLPIPGGAICTFSSSTSSSWGTRATKRGGVFRRAVYLHSAITCFSKHFISKALNSVVLPAKTRQYWSNWQLCSFVQERTSRYYSFRTCDFFWVACNIPEVKSNFWKGQPSKITMLVSLLTRAAGVLVREMISLTSEQWNTVENWKQVPTKPPPVLAAHHSSSTS